MVLLRSLMAFSGFVLVTTLGDVLRFQIDSLVVARSIGIESVAIYGLAVTVTRYATRVANAGVSVLVPRLTRLYAHGDLLNFRARFIQYSNAAGLLACLVGVGFVSAGPTFIDLWVGKDFIRSGPVFLILIAALIPDFATSPSIYALQAMKKHKLYAYNSLLEGAMNLGLSLVLVRHMGLIGVALGTLIPASLTKLIVQPIYCARTIGVDLTEYLLAALGKPIVAAIFPLVIGLVLPSLVLPRGFVALALWTLIPVVLYCALAYWIGLTKENRQFVTRSGTRFAGGAKSESQPSDSSRPATLQESDS